MIRPATFSDIQALCDLLKWAYSQSFYVEYGEFDDKETKAFLTMMLQRMGVKAQTSTLFWVAETDGIITGMMLGGLARVYYIGSKLIAHEVYYFGRGAEARDMSDLLRRFITWAERNERVVEIKMSTSDVVSPERVGQKSWRDIRAFYERRGFAVCGEVLTKRIKR